MNLDELMSNASTQKKPQRKGKVKVSLKDAKGYSPKKEAHQLKKEKELTALKNRLDENINKTDKALEVLKINYSATLELSKFYPRVILGEGASFLKEPDKLKFLTLRGNPKRVLNYIIINLNSNGYFQSETSSMKEDLNINDNALKSSVKRLIAGGYLNSYSVRGVAVRVFKVNPSILEF